MVFGSARCEDYERLMRELSSARAHAGGHLSQEDESKHVAAIDDVWRSMTNEEQDAVEARSSR